MAENQRRSPWQTIRRPVLMLLLLGLGVFLLLPQLTEFGQAIDTVRTMAWWAVGLALIAQALSYMGSGYTMMALVCSEAQSIPLWHAVAVTLAGNSLGLISGGPMATAAGEYRWLRARGVESLDAAVTGGIILQLNNLMVALAALIGIVHLLVLHALTSFEVVSFVIVAATIVFTVAVFAWGRRYPDILVHRLDRIVSRMARFAHRPYRPERLDAGVRSLLSVWDRRKERGWTRPLLGAFLNIAFDMFTLLALFAAAGHPLPLGVLLVGYGLPLLLGKLTILPGGVGVVEATMATLYGSLGVPRDVLVVVILVYRLFSFWIPSLIGFALIPVVSHAAWRA